MNSIYVKEDVKTLLQSASKAEILDFLGLKDAFSPRITQQPNIGTPIQGDSVTVAIETAVVANAGLEVDYVLEQRPNSSGEWSAIAGVDTASWQSPVLEYVDSGRQFRYRPSTAFGEAISNIATVDFKVPYDDTIYLLVIGQSQELSRDNADLSVVTDPRIQILNDAKAAFEPWDLTTNPPQHVTQVSVGNAPDPNYDSMAFYKARALADLTQRNVKIIYCVRGGASLQNWASGGQLYTNLLKQLGHPEVPRIDVIFFHQGEANVGDSSYLSRLQTFRTVLETQSKIPSNCPMVIGELLRSRTGHPEVNAILNAFAASDPDVEIASSEGLTDQGDNLHFNSASLRILAHRYVAFVPAYLSRIISNATGPRPTATATGITSDVSLGEIELSWTDSVDDSVRGYMIERKSGAGQFSKIGSVKPTVKTFTDGTVDFDTTYTYRITGVNAFGRRSSNEHVATSAPEPYFVLQPVDASPIPGQSAIFNASFSDIDAVMEWQEEIESVWEPVEDAADDTLTISNVGEGDVGRKFRRKAVSHGVTYYSNVAEIAGVFNINNLPGLAANFSASGSLYTERTGASATTATTDGGLIGTWKSEDGKYAIASGDASRPTYDADGLGGSEAVVLGVNTPLAISGGGGMFRNKKNAYVFVACAAPSDVRRCAYFASTETSGISRLGLFFNLTNQYPFGVAVRWKNSDAVTQVGAANAITADEIAVWGAEIQYATGLIRLFKNGVQIASSTVTPSQTESDDSDSVQNSIGFQSGNNGLNKAVSQIVIATPEAPLTEQEIANTMKAISLANGGIY